MKITFRALVVLSIAFTSLSSWAVVASEPLGGSLPPPRPPAFAQLDALPIYFEVPSEDASNFVARGVGYVVRLEPTKAVVMTQFAERARAVALEMELVGASDLAVGEGLEPLPGRMHDLRGADPRRWRRDITAYRRLRFAGVYPGIGVDYHGRRGRLEYDFVVEPGASPRSVRLSFHGAGTPRVDDDGGLVLRVEGGTVRQPPPYVYQDENGVRHEIEAAFVLHENGEVGFSVGDYDPTLPLVIDPVILYSELLGGSERDEANDVAVDAEGIVYVVGSTLSDDFPIENASQIELSGEHDIFVMKLDPYRGVLHYVTYLGGEAEDYGYAVALDDLGNAYVVGSTRSPDFPVLDALQSTLRGTGDAFVAILDAAGYPIVATYLGGDDVDMALDVAVDAMGRANVTGSTRSATFPVVGGFQLALAGSSDAFVATLSPTGTAIDYATYLGGSGFDQGLSLAIDLEGRRFVTGETSSIDFPAVAALQGMGGASDAFVARIELDGSLGLATYLGGSEMDRGSAIAVSEDGIVYITGTTRSLDFPLFRPLQTENGGGFDVFVTGLDMRAGGSAVPVPVLFSTYLGGSRSELGLDVTTRAGTVHVAGRTSSVDFFGVAPDEPAPAGGMDAFLARLDADGTNLLYTGMLGGSGSESANGLAVDLFGQIHVVGVSDSSDFLPLDAASTGGKGDAFLLGPDTKRADLEVLVTKARGSGLSIAIDNRGPDTAERVELLVLSDALGETPLAEQGSCWLGDGVAICDLDFIPAGSRVGVQIPGKLKLAGGLARVSALTVDPELLDNTIPLDGSDSPTGRRLFLRVQRAGNGTGEVRSVTDGIRCGNDCLESYPRETHVRLVAEAGPHSRFVGWRAACVGSEDCEVDIDSPTTVVALFERIRVEPGPPPKEVSPPLSPPEPGPGPGPEPHGKAKKKGGR